MTWTLVDSNADLVRIAQELEAADAVAVDTEFMRRNTYYPKIALLQLCTKDHAWLVDPLAVDDLDALRALLSRGTALRILHSCSEDLEVFRHWLGADPEPLVDSQRAAAIVGEGFGLGYRALVERLLGIELEKGETRSDWLKRPLTESQCHYAAQDVIQLVPVWEILHERAQAQGRMGWIVEESEELLRAQQEREGGLFRRIKGSGRLNQRQLGALRNLCNWREARARQVDKPRGWVLEDKACLAIAQALPEALDGLEQIDLIPQAVLRRQGEVLLACVTDALAQPQSDLPAPSPTPLNPAQRDQLKKLRALAKSIGEDHGVAPEILVAASDLELMIREADGASIERPRRWSGWRREVVIEPLLGSIGSTP